MIRRSRGLREAALASTASSRTPKGRGHRPDRDLATALYGQTNVNDTHTYTYIHAASYAITRANDRSLCTAKRARVLLLHIQGVLS